MSAALGPQNTTFNWKNTSFKGFIDGCLFLYFVSNSRKLLHFYTNGYVVHLFETILGGSAAPFCILVSVGMTQHKRQLMVISGHIKPCNSVVHWCFKTTIKVYGNRGICCIRLRLHGHFWIGLIHCWFWSLLWIHYQWEIISSLILYKIDIPNIHTENLKKKKKKRKKEKKIWYIQKAQLETRFTDFQL